IPFHILAVGLGVLGVFGVIVGATLYTIVLKTRLFLGDLTRPFFDTFKTRVYLAQIIVLLPFLLGFGLLIAIPLSPLLRKASLDSSTAFAGAALGMVLLGQIPMIWFQIWAPLEQ